MLRGFCAVIGIVTWLNFVLYDIFGALRVLISLYSGDGMKVNDGRILKRWEWRAMQVQGTAWYNE